MAADAVPTRFGSYVRGEELGRGAFGCVFVCEKVGNDQRFAAKAIDLRRLRLSQNAGKEIKKLQREANILKKVPPHPNLVQFVDTVQEGNWLFFVLELVNGGNLFSVLVQRPGKKPRLREFEGCFVFRQLVEGLHLLHSHGVIHRDLKLENVLVVNERHVGPDVLLDVKIADFGLSKVVGDGLSEAHSTVGSPRYMAPEVWAKGIHDFKADLWSLGVLCHVLLDGRFPCEGVQQRSQSTIDAAVGKLPVGEHARSLVSGLLQLKPEARLGVDQLRQHPWLANSDACRSGSTPAKRIRLWSKEPRPLRTKVSLECLFSKRDDEAVTEAANAVSKAVSSPTSIPSLGSLASPRSRKSRIMAKDGLRSTRAKSQSSATRIKSSTTSGESHGQNHVQGPGSH